MNDTAGCISASHCQLGSSTRQMLSIPVPKFAELDEGADAGSVVLDEERRVPRHHRLGAIEGKFLEAVTLISGIWLAALRTICLFSA